MKHLALGVALSALMAGSAFGQTAPTWHSCSVTGNLADCVSSPTVATWFGTKADLKGTATNGTTTRDLRDRFADRINVKDFGATGNGTSDDTGAFNAALGVATNPLRVAGADVYVPAGIYHIAGQIAATFAGTQMVRFEGDGLGSELLIDNNGPQFTVNAVPGAVGGLDVRGLLLRHNSTSTQGGDGLTITGSGGTIAVFMRNVRADGVASAGSWNIGYELTNVNLAADHVEAHIPDEDSAAYTGATYGMDIEGTVTSPGNYIYSLDNKITNSVFEGGEAGLHLGGPWQGLYFANSIALGNNYGVMGDNAALPGQQNMLVTNDHINAHLAGVYARGVNQIAVSNVLFLHLGGPADPFATVDAGNAQEVSVTGTTFNGSGSGDEEVVRLTSIHEATITGNNAITLHGPYIDVDSTSSNVAAFGNEAANFSGYSGPRTIGCGGSVSCGSNNWDGSSDYSFDGTNISLSMPGALFSAGQMFVGSAAGGQSYGFRSTGGSLVNALTMDSSGNQTLGSGASAVTLGSATVPVHIPGLSSLGQASVNTLVFDPSGTPPASSSSACTAGQAAWTSGYLYVCTASNTWQRAVLSSF